jgi:pSer/pThr/pTyr-binding forkhead associated (FHA) protein
MNDLNPKSKTVSSMHSKLERVAGRYKLTDLSSSQGTFVNGRRIDSKLLNDGDEISFESIKYTFSISGRAR